MGPLAPEACVWPSVSSPVTHPPIFLRNSTEDAAQPHPPAWSPEAYRLGNKVVIGVGVH